MDRKISIQLKILFAVRVCLWIVAFVSTAYWIWYSGKLTYDGVFDPYQYSTLLRPVLYRNLAIAIAAVCISFVLHALSVKLKAKAKREEL